MTHESPILITGATGFVGACLAHHHVKQEREVHVITRPTSNMWRLQSIQKKLRIHDGDLNEFESLQRLIKNIQPKIIYHCAAYGAYPGRQEETDSIMKTNVLGTIHLLKACESIEYDALINTGSSSEYGEKDKPMAENDALEPYNDYGVSKAAATLFCRAYARQHKRPVVTARLFSVYGPYEEAFRLIPSILLGTVRNKTIHLSSPHPVRDFIHVDDVIRAYERMSKVANEHRGEVFNVGTGIQMSIGGMIEKMKAKVNGMPPVEWGSVENPRTEPKAWRADTHKSKNQLKWQAEYSMDEGILKTLDWFRNNESLYRTFANS